MWFRKRILCHIEWPQIFLVKNYIVKACSERSWGAFGASGEKQIAPFKYSHISGENGKIVGYDEYSL